MTAQVDVSVAESPAPAICAQSLGKDIDDRPILQAINLRIEPGSYVALLGANGAGKSTLLKILATLTPPTRGRLELFGRPADRDTPRLRARIGLIGHQSMLYGHLSARENLEFFGGLYGLADAAARAQRLLESVGLAQRADDPVRAFSRGMMQRVSIARALVHDPDLLLADEPFAGLDVPSARALEAMLAALHSAGKTVVLVNHDIEQSLRLAGRIVVLRRGKVTLDRPSQQTDAARALEAAV